MTRVEIRGALQRTTMAVTEPSRPDPCDRNTTSRASGGVVIVATFNVENLFERPRAISATAFQITSVPRRRPRGAGGVWATPATSA